MILPTCEAKNYNNVKLGTDNNSLNKLFELPQGFLEKTDISTYE